MGQSGWARRCAHVAFGETVMAAAATCLPDAKRGCYSGDPAARAAAEAVSAFPFDQNEVRGM
jgi:hypothetical protein